MVFTVWSGVTYTNTCFVKWSWKTKTLAALGNWFSSNVVSILVKSTYRRSRGAVATIGHKGALGMPPSYWRQHVQALITCLIYLAIPSHQKCSCNKDSVWSWPWCPASQWHPFKAAVQCAFTLTPWQGHLLWSSGWHLRFLHPGWIGQPLGPRWVVIRLSMSASVLSCPFWYSNWKLNFTRDPTHWWSVASKLGVVIIYVKGLLSVLTKEGWYNKYSLKCFMTAHCNGRNSSLVEW